MLGQCRSRPNCLVETYIPFRSGDEFLKSLYAYVRVGERGEEKAMKNGIESQVLRPFFDIMYLICVLFVYSRN